MNSEIISKTEKKEQNKSKLENLKSKYILKQIFEHFNSKKALEIIRYNKYFQNKFNVNISFYQEYSQSYSSIIIELNLADNKYGKFINIPELDKEYYHIYFDNSKEEINREYLKVNEKIKIIKIVIKYQIKSLKDLFANCSCISSIVFKQFSRNNITHMNNMFYKCTSLKKIDFSNFNTNKVSDMSYMFYKCSSLKELNLSNFNTNKVINMSNHIVLKYGVTHDLKFIFE